jgi:hypothetical protein
VIRAGKWLLALSLLAILAVRLLSPAGFMPSFDHGAVTIVACPDGQPDGPLSPAHHDGHSKKLHQPCPYAEAAGLSSLAPEYGALIAVVTIAIALLLGRTFLFIERNRTRERPPSRGPPIPA